MVRNRWARLLAAVGRPDPDLLDAAASGIDGRWDLIAPIDQLERLSRLLPRWRPEPAVIHELPVTVPAGGVGADASPPAADVDVRWIDRRQAALVDHLTGELAEEIASALGRVPMVAAFVGGRPVSFCYAHLETESLWDVAIDTLEGFRRRGLATACARHLIAHQLGRGKRPVWGAMAGNRASRELAARLGFVACGRLAVLERYGADAKGNL